MGYTLLKVPERAGPYFVHTVYGAGPFRSSLGGTLLRSPYANAEILAALGEAKADEPNFLAAALVKKGDAEGVMVQVNGRDKLAVLQEEAIPHIAAYLDRKMTGFQDSGRFIDCQWLNVNASMSGKVAQEWEKLTGQKPLVIPEQDYYLHSEVLSPPPLPATDARVRRGRSEDLDLLSRQAARQFRTPFVVEGGDVIKSGIYNVAPVGQSGAFLTAMHLDMQSETKFLQPVVEKAMREYRQSDGGILLPPSHAEAKATDLASHFSALARTMQQEGRWFMVSAATDSMDQLSPIGRYESQTIRAAAEKLGFMPAGGQDIVALPARPVPQYGITIILG